MRVPTPEELEAKVVAERLAEMAADEKTDIVEQKDGSVTIALRVPVKRQNERVESVTLRRPTATELMMIDLNATKHGDLSTCIGFVHAVSGLTREEVDGLDGADFMFIANAAIGRFFRRRPRQLAGAAR